MKIKIEGYGSIRIVRPKKNTKKSFDKSVTSAVVQTLNLVDPKAQGKSFHPALGMGDHRGN